MTQDQNGPRSKWPKVKNCLGIKLPKGKLVEVAKWPKFIMTLSLGPKVKMAYDRNSLRSKRTKVKLAKFEPLYMDLVSVIFSDLAFLRRGVK